jgi:hypothetical protein
MRTGGHKLLGFVNQDRGVGVRRNNHVADVELPADLLGAHNIGIAAIAERHSQRRLASLPQGHRQNEAAIDSAAQFQGKAALDSANHVLCHTLKAIPSRRPAAYSGTFDTQIAVIHNQALASAKPLNPAKDTAFSEPESKINVFEQARRIEFAPTHARYGCRA